MGQSPQAANGIVVGWHRGRETKRAESGQEEGMSAILGIIMGVVGILGMLAIIVATVIQDSEKD